MAVKVSPQKNADDDGRRGAMANKQSKKMVMFENSNRFIKHGSFGLRGRDRVRLLQSSATKIFYADYYERGTLRRRRVNFNTTDLDSAKAQLANLMHAINNAPLVMHSGETVLYVVQRGDGGPIKVGISRNLKSRVEQLQSGNAERLRVARVYKMTDVEKSIHAHLEKSGRLNGEWFPAELLAMIDRILSERGRV